MKKVIILSAAIMAFSFVTPQVAKAMKLQNEMTVGQDKDKDDKFKEIKVTELPEAVTKSISTAYTGSKIDKAYLGEDNSYKVKVSMGELKYNLFYDAKGELIKVEEPTSKGDLPTDKGMSPANKSMEPANKSMEPTNKGTEPTKSTQPAGTETPKTY